MEPRGATLQVILPKGAMAKVTPLQGAPVRTLRPIEAAEAKLQALRQEDVRTPEERRFKLQDLQPKALIRVNQAEGPTVEEEVHRTGLKPMIRVEEEIVYNPRIAASAAIFFNTKAVLFLLKIHRGLFLQESVPLFEF